MRSLPKVLKLAGMTPSDEVYHIPDSGPHPPPQSLTGDPPEGEPRENDPGQMLRELEAEEEAARQRIQRLTREAKEQAEETAQKVLQGAKNERVKMMDQAQADAARIREEARQSGYSDALAQKQGEIDGKLAELDRLMARLQEDQTAFLRQYEEGLAALSLEIAQKVLDEAVMADGTLMRPLVQKAVSSVKNAEWISVEVSSRLPGLVEELKKELAKRPDLPRLDVSAADMPPGGCRVQTPEGVVDASVSTQLGNLKGLFDGPR